ncbi:MULTISPECIES: sugar phosphate isomerase/epimerase family protein [unclassified Pantoea]|uniref:sugar phosphate isomerase/epimerase family protein n=1 Tax=unclassified Pantoea TaxID=2630326 RepID=UPI001CD43CEC|nr:MULTISPECIES: sugar phosphate isomerase/epimerase [unclassified Pantoea]MCA1177414.1 sugar phosphate isomerase/epimerase [Pantoea sp. alder69]MCA1249680.1 sugar phosphate isomerase/epimerase [Pantoea sp. alder70]MCA1265903.1 sugar phosphate isomerase/epimerase [Pantoea sp. alder81]
MKLSFCTDSLGHLPFEQMLDKLLELGVYGVEMTTGGWSSAPHLPTEALLASATQRQNLLKALESRGMSIAALNVSGNPLDPGELGQKHKRDTENALALAGELGVKKIVMMSGLPPASPHDTIPNWITYTVSWPPTLKNCQDYQWNEVAIPYWQGLVARAKQSGVEKFALENFSSMLVWNPETLFRLRNAVGDMVGLNLDPSHLLWMGADPIAAARALGPAIHHCHGKDVRMERGLVNINGLLETKPVEDVANRAWNYVAVGCGQDLQWWKEFFSVVRMMGYNDWVSLEMEDLTMSVEAGVTSSIAALKQTISQ